MTEPAPSSDQEKADVQVDGENATGTAAEEKPEEIKKSRAVFLTGFGGMKHVKVMMKEELQPAKHEVAIRVSACGVNFPDLMTRQGLIESVTKTPFVMGCESVGKIEAVGEEVTDFKVDDVVVAILEQGAWAERLVAPADCLYKIPKEMSAAEAAGMAFSYLPAYMMLRDVACVRPGDTVLIHSAGGGVGLAIAQLSKVLGGFNLIGTASKSKHDAIKDQFSLLLDHEQDYVAEIRKLHPGGIRIVLDCLSGEDINKGISLLQPLGRYVLYGASNFVTGEKKSLFSVAKSWWQIDRVSPLKLYEENKTLAGFSLRSLLFRQGQTSYVRNCWNELVDLYRNGKIKPVVDSEWAFEDVKEAMQKLHDRRNIGKVILNPQMSPMKEENGEKPKENEEPKANENATEQ